MTPLKWLIVLCLAAFMIFAAFGFGRWAESINPDGISAAELSVDTAEETAEKPTENLKRPTSTTPTIESRDAFKFGASIGLLAAALLYGTFAIALLIRAKSTNRSPDQLTYWIAGLAGLGLALSYLVDDFFY